MMLSRSLLFAGLLSALPLALGSSDAGYEVWASDQSNSASNQDSLGVKGGFLWIFDSEDITKQLAGGGAAKSLPCTPDATEGPCDTMQIFPQQLVETNADGTTTGQTLGSLPLFGRLHGVIKDPQNKYVNANFFATGKL